MSSYLVLFLVFSPIQPFNLPAKASQPVWEALKDLATILELSGPTCSWVDHFANEVHWVRNQYRNCQDYPSIGECSRLPRYGVCVRYYQFSLEYQRYLSFCAETRSYLDLSGPLREARQLSGFWFTACQAQDTHNHWCSRRACLAQLRDLLGPEEWHAGQWPPPVPLWSWEDVP